MPDSSQRMVLTVSVLNQFARRVLEQNQTLSNVLVEGEISNFKRHSSGHLYFTLKDAKASISCVMFASDASRCAAARQVGNLTGQKVLVRGYVSLYEVTGSFQLYVRGLQLAGQGDLYALFAQLKDRLAREGLFDETYKKPIPAYPRRIGIVTSPTGAAIHDILTVSKRRYPGVRLVLYPSLVQGAEAADSIVRGIRVLDAMEDVDTIIIGRGGGSLEDLWPFNEEKVARAVYAAKTPIISAVGHETDFSISDFAADLRAATPSAAAELAVPNIADTLYRVNAQVETQRRRVQEQMLALRSKEQMLGRHLTLLSPSKRLADAYLSLDRLAARRDERMNRVIQLRRLRLQNLETALELQSPVHQLERGYAFVTGEDGRVISSVKETNPSDILKITMKDGSLKVEVKGEN